MDKLNHEIIMKTLDWGYDKAVTGVAGLDSAKELAEKYLAKEGELHEKCNSLINWQVTKAGGSGFVTNLGGPITLPVTIPANIGSVLFIQIRMVAAIAHMCGHDLRDDRVRTLVFMCLIGDSITDILKDVGIAIGTKVTTRVIEKISEKTIIEINKKVGFRLLTKFGEKGVINLSKAVPIVGGIIGGSIDAASTKIVGKVARDTFIENRPKKFLCFRWY